MAHLLLRETDATTKTTKQRQLGKELQHTTSGTGETAMGLLSATITAIVIATSSAACIGSHCGSQGPVTVSSPPSPPSHPSQPSTGYTLSVLHPVYEHRRSSPSSTSSPAPPTSSHHSDDDGMKAGMIIEWRLCAVCRGGRGKL